MTQNQLSARYHVDCRLTTQTLCKQKLNVLQRQRMFAIKI